MKFGNDEMKTRWANIHLAGHKRYYFNVSGVGEPDLVEELTKKETDDLSEAINMVKDFFEKLLEREPDIIYDCENKGYIEINDEVLDDGVTVELSELSQQYINMRILAPLIGETEKR